MMAGILTDLSASTLTNAIKSNLYSFFKFLKKAPGTEFLESPQYLRWYNPIQHPWFNGVLSQQSGDPVEADTVRETVAYFKAKGAQTMTWWLESGLGYETWETVLAPYGFRLSDDTPGMALDLKRLNADLIRPLGVEIEPVTDAETLRAWNHVFTVGYGLPTDWEEAIFALMLGLGLDFPMRNYLCCWNGKPVATSSVYYAAGVAGVQFIATLPEARGHGIGTAVTIEPLKEALQLGYRVGILQSSEMGFNVYKKIGFQHLCQMEHFYLRL